MGAAEVAARFPDIEIVRAWSRSLATLDAILSPEWEYRYFSFDAQWSAGEEMASMRNGSGDEYSIVFGEHGAFVRGFDHESPLSPWAQDPPAVAAGLIDEVPAVFQAQLDEPAFSIGGIMAVTVCIWRETGDPSWQAGRVTAPALQAEEDSADWLFELLDGRPESYVAFAEEYYERAVSLDAVSHVFEGQPLSATLVTILNPEADAEVALQEARRMGYPVDA